MHVHMCECNGVQDGIRACSGMQCYVLLCHNYERKLQLYTSA